MRFFRKQRQHREAVAEDGFVQHVRERGALRHGHAPLQIFPPCFHGKIDGFIAFGFHDSLLSSKRPKQKLRALLCIYIFSGAVTPMIVSAFSST